MMKTVGELKKFINDLPDDMLLVNYKNDMEISGYMNKLLCDVVNMKKETDGAYDAFDGTYFAYEVLVETDDGMPCLRFS